MTIAVIACGALANHVHEIAQRRSWDLHVEPVNPLLHNRPEGIAPEVEELVNRLKNKFEKIAVAYADCGTYGELDKVCDKYEIKDLLASTVMTYLPLPRKCAKSLPKSQALLFLLTI